MTVQQVSVQNGWESPHPSAQLTCTARPPTLPTSSEVEEFKATKPQAVSTLLSVHSFHQMRQEVESPPSREAESPWKHQEIVGVVYQGRLGLVHYCEKNLESVRQQKERQVKSIG